MTTQDRRAPQLVVQQKCLVQFPQGIGLGVPARYDSQNPALGLQSVAPPGLSKNSHAGDG